MAQAKIGNSIKRVVVVVVHRLLLLTTTDWQQHQAHRSRGHRLGGQSGSRGLVRTLARASDGLPCAPVKAPAAEWMAPARGAGEGARPGRVRSEEERRRGRRPRGRYGQRVKMVEPLKSDSRVAEELLDNAARMQSKMVE